MTALSPNATGNAPPSRNAAWMIFLVSMLGLYLELMLIRWLSTEVRIFAYLQNTVLVVCFLGIGMGCFTSRQPANLRGSLLALLSLALLMAIPVSRLALENVTSFFGLLDDLVIWQTTSYDFDWLGTAFRVGLGLGLTLLLTILLWEVFLPLGRILGRLIDDHPHTIWAYSVNVAGSLVGIGLFVLASALWLPPVAWVAFSVVLMAVFLGTGRERWVNLGLTAALIVAAWFAGRDSGSQEVVWSPYQKLVLKTTAAPEPGQKYFWAGKQLILVNNAHYQGIIDLGEESVRGNPTVSESRRGLSQYDVPLLLHPRPARVLIVGAGSGNDAAGALRGGAERVTAVEIDPAIIDMGRRHHPEQPYASPKTRVVIDDARSFFATTQDKYDLIIFGLLDSHTTTAMTNARLDHYIYTRESIERARALLAEGGVMALSFEAAKPFIADRMAGCIREVFDAQPLTFRIPADNLGWGGVMFVAGDQQAIQSQLQKNPRLATAIAEWQAARPVTLTYSASIATDDWPYIYLERPSIPTLYFLLFLALGALLWRCSRKLQLPAPLVGWSRSHWHFFFLGAAFLLLEVQNISKASVVLGNTWLVSAVIIAGVLLMVLVANLIAARFPKIPHDLLTVCLVGSCLGLYFVDLARFAFLPYASKAVIVGLLTCLPMLFSGILFIRSFAQIERKDLALGANMYGALAGALLQSVTFLVGIKALLLIVAGLYVAALLTRPQSSPKADPRTDLDEGDAPDADSPRWQETPELVDV